jgi:hypothetical protein
MERARAMTAHGRRVGHDAGKRLVKADRPTEGRLALLLAIEVEESASPRDAWCAGYVEGLHDALREHEGKSSLSRLGR